MFRSVSLVALALLLGTPAYAQDETGEIDEIFSWATPAMPGCAVAVSHRGELVVNRAYGLADLERGVPLSPSSTFDIGSNQKQFVAAAVLLLVDEGRLSLSDDVREHIPELPDYGHTVALDHLLTHTSGVRDWTGMLPLSADDPDALTLILRQRGLNFAPGEEWSYSNSGYVLLREVVARASGMPFDRFLRERVFEPLGMQSTAYVDDAQDGTPNVALAYEKRDEVWEQDMMLGNARGGGALLTTASDLITWSDALANERLGAFVSEKIQERARLNNGRQLTYARGLFVDTIRGRTVVWHTGSAAAYKSVLSRFPEQDLSVAILCNAGEAADARTMYASRIFDVFVPDFESAEGSAPAAVAAEVDVPEADLNASAGLFFSERDGQPLHLIVNDGTLRFAGGPPLLPVAADRFRNPGGSLAFMSQAEFELHFLSQDRFEVESSEGETTRYRRARSYAPTPAELNAFTGRYESDEIGAVFRIEAGEGRLVARLEHAPEQTVPFTPVDPDAFMLSRMLVRFVRDESGDILGFDYSNPAVRNIRFVRLSDGE